MIFLLVIHLYNLQSKDLMYYSQKILCKLFLEKYNISTFCAQFWRFCFEVNICIKVIHV